MRELHPAMRSLRLRNIRQTSASNNSSGGVSWRRIASVLSRSELLGVGYGGNITLDGVRIQPERPDGRDACRMIR